MILLNILFPWPSSNIKLLCSYSDRYRDGACQHRHCHHHQHCHCHHRHHRHHIAMDMFMMRVLHALVAVLYVCVAAHLMRYHRHRVFAHRSSAIFMLHSIFRVTQFRQCLWMTIPHTHTHTLAKHNTHMS